VIALAADGRRFAISTLFAGHRAPIEIEHLLRRSAAISTSSWVDG
jgi:hypothetical protein